MFGCFGGGGGKNRKEQSAQLSAFLTEYAAKVKKIPVRGVQEDDSFTLLFATVVLFLQIRRGNLE
jgi:hypothetical protein